MRPLSAAALLGLGTAGVGGWYKFRNLEPTTLRQYLEWQGLRLISDSESNYWNAVLEEHKEFIKESGLDNSKIDGIKQWCKDNIDSKDYENLKSKALRLCVDNPKTIKARIIQLDGGTGHLINGNDADNKYKVSYVFRKHIDGFNSLISYSPQMGDDGKEVENLDVAKDAFKKWCTDSLDKPIDETLVQNIRTLCTPKKFSTIEDLIKQNKEDKMLLTEDSNKSDLESKYNTIKELSTWTADNTGSKSDSSDLKTWCETNKSKNFHEPKVFSETYPKFRFRCLKGTTADPK
ncbi:hypothetical protein MHF_1135 [Mycoplasma haemofelis Ohio2]|uniref:Uncharacterized protein n=1 Tax=Mycoplasma haemofelis (strain Ohio2) TaxID=859194 RepID=F6FJM3_MYCHI|nr:hypothetical protein MHF_1135 [Mycoplasma haemofelis Ohio2]